MSVSSVGASQASDPQGQLSTLLVQQSLKSANGPALAILAAGNASSQSNLPSGVGGKVNVSA